MWESEAGACRNGAGGKAEIQGRIIEECAGMREARAGGKLEHGGRSRNTVWGKGVELRKGRVGENLECGGKVEIYGRSVEECAGVSRVREKLV